MESYQSMTKQQRKDFRKVIVVVLVGIIMVFLVPIVYHLVF